MNRIKRIILIISIALLLAGCRANNASSVEDKAGAVDFQSTASDTSSAIKQESDGSTESISQTEETEKMNEAKLKIEINGHTLTARLADNAAAKELAELVKEAPLTLQLNEYGGFEKVGALPQSLPTDDRRVNTEPGDIMLYMGNQITIFYGANAWSYTPLGKIENAEQDSLKNIFGKGDVTVILTLA